MSCQIRQAPAAGLRWSRRVPTTPCSTAFAPTGPEAREGPRLSGSALDRPCPTLQAVLSPESRRHTPALVFTGTSKPIAVMRALPWRSWKEADSGWSEAAPAHPCARRHSHIHVHQPLLRIHAPGGIRTSMCISAAARSSLRRSATPMATTSSSLRRARPATRRSAASSLSAVRRSLEGELPKPLVLLKGELLVPGGRVDVRALGGDLAVGDGADVDAIEADAASVGDGDTAADR